MGLHVSIDRENQRADIWACLTSGCVRYEEGESSVDVNIEDRNKDGLRIERRAVLRKRENWKEYIHDIINGNTPTVSDEPKADEGQLLEIYKFVVDKIVKGMRYVGVRTEFITPRGIRVYFRLRHNEQSDGLHVIVELLAEKEGERVSYQVFGQTANAFVLREEAARAIGTYVLFSEYIAKQTGQQSN